LQLKYLLTIFKKVTWWWIRIRRNLSPDLWHCSAVFDYTITKCISSAFITV